MGPMTPPSPYDGDTSPYEWGGKLGGLADGHARREGAEQPQHEKDDENQAEHAAEAAEAGSAVARVGVVAAATAEHDEKDDDDQEQAHGRPAFRGTRGPGLT